mgnify:CR=1 FL=1
MIRLNDLTIGYGRRILLQHASATIPAGELVALVGRNGTGKSTLLRAIAGLGERLGGEIRLDGHSLETLSPQQLATTVSFVTTERVRIPNLRCEDVVALGRAPYTNWIGRVQEQDKAIVERSLELVGMAAFAGKTMDRMSDGDARRIVCMSSTYIAMLDALGEPQRVVGVSGIDYISNPYVASHKEQIGDVGYDGNMNYERLLSLSPDIVLLFGVSGASAMEPKLRELGIPYAYMGEYLEQSPLGKAEWLVAVAEIAGMRERGEEVFREIPLRYDSLKTLAAKAERKPVVMLNTPYGDSWLMAPPSSYVARLIADAGGQYVYTQDTGNQSRPIDTEEAYRLAEMSDCWINVGSAASLKELAEIVPKFMDTRPVREGRVYNNNRRTNPSGGNDYWESGVIHPDLILQDLIRIFHPELTDAEPTYYRKLN